MESKPGQLQKKALTAKNIEYQTCRQKKEQKWIRNTTKLKNAATQIAKFKRKFAFHNIRQKNTKMHVKEAYIQRMDV